MLEYSWDKKINLSPHTTRRKNALEFLSAGSGLSSGAHVSPEYNLSIAITNCIMGDPALIFCI